MHIPIPTLSEPHRKTLISDLELLINQPTAQQSPPCPNCVDDIQASWNKNNCSQSCVNAPHALSEDPELYPIEKNVVPLVFELTTMRLVHTCWSCEGHLDIDGEIWKLPQVSFYSDKPIYAQLLSNYLANIHWKKKIYYPWEIGLTNYGRLFDITYTLRCDLSNVRRPDIHVMQKDLQDMAVNLSENIKLDAIKLIEQLKNESAES